MKILISPYFERKYKKLIKKDRSLSKILDKKFSLFRKNKKYPSLRLHKLEGKVEEWSISVKGNLRIIFKYVKEGIYITDIGPHDEVY